jgi:hypothetical protein
MTPQELPDEFVIEPRNERSPLNKSILKKENSVAQLEERKKSPMPIKSKILSIKQIEVDPSLKKKSLLSTKKIETFCKK